MKHLLIASVLLNIVVLSISLAILRPYMYMDNAELVLTSEYSLEAWNGGYEAGASRVAGAAANYINDMESDDAIEDLLMLISIHLDMDDHEAEEYISSNTK